MNLTRDDGYSQAGLKEYGNGERAGPVRYSAGGRQPPQLPDEGTDGDRTRVELLLRRSTEPLDQLSRELGVEAHRLAAWLHDLLEHGRQG